MLPTAYDALKYCLHRQHTRFWIREMNLCECFKLVLIEVFALIFLAYSSLAPLCCSKPLFCSLKIFLGTSVHIEKGLERHDGE